MIFRTSCDSILYLNEHYLINYNVDYQNNNEKLLTECKSFKMNFMTLFTLIKHTKKLTSSLSVFHHGIFVRYNKKLCRLKGLK